MSEERALIRQNLSAQEQIRLWRQQLVRNLLRLFLVIGIFAVAVGSYNAVTRMQPALIGIYVVAYLLLVVAYGWKKAPYEFQVGVILVIAYALGVVDFILYGWAEDGRVFLLSFAVLTAIFLGMRVGLVALGLMAVTLLGFSLAYTQGVLPVPWDRLNELYGFSTLLSTAVIVTSLGALLVVAQNYLTPRLLEALDRSAALARELEAQQSILEDRAQALQQANLAFQRRAMYLEATAQVAQAIATIFDQEALLQKIVDLVTEYFGFYHTGIFLVDETEEWAVLQAASSAGGKEMLAAGHRLSRGEESMVGWVVEHRQSRIALDVGKDASHFVNPYLPATRSEVAVPLLVAGRLLGVLDVQSTEEAAFDQDDVRVLESLAGQVAIALENARRLSEEAAFLEATSPFYRLTRRLATARTAQQVYVAMLETVRDYNPQRAVVLAVDPDQKRLIPSAELRATEVTLVQAETDVSAAIAWRGQLYQVALTLQRPLLVDDLLNAPADLGEGGQEALALLAQSLDAHSAALIPLQVEARPLALLLVGYEMAHRFTPAEERFYQTMIDVAGVALESARLYQDTQRRAARERLAREVADKLRRATNMDDLLQTAVQEIRTVLGTTDAFVQLGVLPGTLETGPEQE